MTLLNGIYTWIKDRIAFVVRGVTSALQELHARWARHVDRTLDDPDYAQAIRDLVETVALLFKPGVMAKFIADQIFTAYVALLRLSRPPSQCVPGIVIWA